MTIFALFSKKAVSNFPDALDAQFKMNARTTSVGAQSFVRRGISTSHDLMSDFIHVTLKEDESLLVEPRRYDLVIDVSREAIMNDLSDEHSVVRQKFQTVPDFEKFINENLTDVQKTIAGVIALTYTRRSNPGRLSWHPVEQELRVRERPSRDYDDAVGPFGIWVL